MLNILTFYLTIEIQAPRIKVLFTTSLNLNNVRQDLERFKSLKWKAKTQINI